MDTDQRFVRYVFPGLAAVVVLATALLLTYPQLLCRLAGNNRGFRAFAALAAIFIGSGGLGYLLTQAHFALPWSIIDHTGFFTDKEHKWHTSIPVSESSWEAAKKDKNVARPTVHFLWHKLVVKDTDCPLDKSTNRQATWMSAIGATGVGVVVGLSAWLVLSLRTLARRPGWCGGVLGGLLFILMLVVLWLAYRRVRKSLKTVVELGLADALPKKKGKQLDRDVSRD